MFGMTTRGYTILGWLTWQIAKWVGKRKMDQNKAKLGGGAAVLGLLALGLIAAKATGGRGDDDDS
jgi:hypothetical protein